MLDDVAAGLIVMSGEGSPTDQLVNLFTAVHDYLEGFPWVVKVLREGELFGRPALYLVEEALTVFERAGITGQAALVGYSALWDLVLGHLVGAPGRTPQALARRAEVVASVNYADLPRVAALERAATEVDPEEIFHAGLRQVVDGLLGRNPRP
ncbi:MAG: TetR/AcrR family transcriptional regulator C-terminal domain-containing protein [Nocardioides sp.]